jgi:galactose mutarotase-like enzyme
LHGLVTQASWEPAGPGTVAIDLPQPWPWRGRLTHSISVEADRAEFRLELRVEEPMPAALGWHPWFLRHVSGPDGSTTGPVRLDAQPGHMYGNDETGLPTGQLVPPVGLPWDYAFVDFPAPPRVIWPGFLELSVESSCPIYVLYDWEPQGICIEPWTAPPNSLNMPDHLVVTPDQPLIATMAWRWRRLGPEVTL